MAHRRSSIETVVLIFLLLLGSISVQKVSAQVVRDGTLGPAAGPLAGPNYAITSNLGKQVGSNLFHSFSKFSIYQNESATFSGPQAIQNIISRVTGGNTSYIDGLLKSTIQGANMFFVNPAGVMFGPHASLDVSGSFHVTTADYLKLGQSGRFDASNPGGSVLTSDPPSAFGFLGPSPAGVSFDQSFMQVPTGKTLSVIAGDIQMQNSTLFAQGGKINLASAASAGEVRPADKGLVMEGFTRQGNIIVSRDTAFTNHTDIDVSTTEVGQDGGAVYIRAGRFELQGGSIDARTKTMGNIKGGGVNIWVTDDVVLDAMGIQYGGSIDTSVENYENTGNGGDVVIEGKRLNVRGGGRIYASTDGTGHGGDINISTSESVLIAGENSGLYSRTYYSNGTGGSISVTSPMISIAEKGSILSETWGDGSAGDIRLDVGKLDLSGGAQIDTSTSGNGKAGNINITATDSVSISGEHSRIFANTYMDSGGKGGNISVTSPEITIAEKGSITSTTVGDGNAGDIRLDMGKLDLSGGAQVDTSTSGNGKAGNINITATDSVAIAGKYGGLYAGTYSIDGEGGIITVVAPLLTIADEGSIRTETSFWGRGSAGDIRLNVGKLDLSGGAQVITSTFGNGQGGNITISATESVDIRGMSSMGLGSGLYANTSYYGDGKGGSIIVSTPTMNVVEGGAIQATTNGGGNAGDIRLDVNKLYIDSGEVSARTYGTGQGGTINVSASELVDIRGGDSLLFRAGLFTSSDWSTGAGGSITVSAPVMMLAKGGFVEADGNVGNGGDITLKIGTLSVTGDARVSASTYGSGRGGTLSLDVGALNLTGGAQVITSTFGNGQGGNIIISATESVDIRGMSSMGLGSGLYANTSYYGDGKGGSINISTPAMSIRDGGLIWADTAGDGKAGDISLSVGTLTLSGGSQLSTSTSGAGLGGIINITATQSVNISGIDEGIYPSGVFADTSGAGNGGSINISTPAMSILDGGRIRAKTAGDGKAGDINLSVGTLTLSGGGQLSTSTSGTGHGGSITVDTAQLYLTRNSKITSESTGTGSAGSAGNIIIHAADTVRLEDSSITTATENADGGNITIDPWLIDLTRSSITATVKGGTGNGGNIGLIADNIILDGSKIIANAEYGSGGNININSTLFLQSPDSIVSASSQFGLQGSVEISAPYIDIGSSIVDLPENLLNIQALLPKPCAERVEEISSFVVSVRDGLPLQPDALLAHPYSYRMQVNKGMEQMVEALRRGDFQSAISHGSQEEQSYATLLYLSSAYQAIGHYRQAMLLLKKAVDMTRKSDDTQQLAATLAELGQGYLLANQLPEAEKLLKEAIRLARDQEDMSLTASILNYMGNLYVLRKEYSEALKAYKEGLDISEKTDDDLLAARIAANAARVSLLMKDRPNALLFLDSARNGHTSLPDSHDKAYGLISVGRMYRTMSMLFADQEGYSRRSALTSLKEALDTATRIKDHLSSSYASGYLGEVYEDSRRYDDALSMTRQAIFEAQFAGAPESLYLWHWQNGRLMKAGGKISEAVLAYRKAVLTLQSIRYEFSCDSRIYNQLTYKDSIEPVYLGFIDLLLRQTDSLQDPNRAETFILEAIQNIELLRTDELQDYFQNTCVAARKAKVDRPDLISPHRAIIYFVPLQDRLEVLLGLPTGLKKFTVQLDRDTLTKEIREFRRNLEKRTSREYLVHAQRLYEWLIRPFEADLSSAKVDTLVFVPEGPLRTIPLSALHDGNDFLVTRYAATSTPALTLVDFQPPRRDKTEVLLTGLSESVQGYQALTYVPFELNTVQRSYGGRVLLNKDFTIPLMRKEIEKLPYSIIHIASHGEFSEDALKTYVLTWDEKLNMDQLENIVGITRFRRNPVELLTLSACQSAGTNDRAALGLAGLSVKAGAKSALATLWYINDQASSNLVVEFYRHLSGKSLSKTKALQRAQMMLLKDERYRHPCYWAPFLLVGSWL